MNKLPFVVEATYGEAVGVEAMRILEFGKVEIEGSRMIEASVTFPCPCCGERIFVRMESAAPLPEAGP